jgi:hypothetical protein
VKSRDEGKRQVSIAILPDSVNTIRLPLKPTACWRLGDGVFRFDHKLIGREAKDEFDEFWSIRERRPRSPIALFGHADPTGDDEYNHTLAAERATAVYAVLNADPDMWHELFANDSEALASLKLVLRSYDQFDPDEEGFGPATAEAVRAHFDYLGSGRKLEPYDYLEDGLAALQSCSEFNPVLRMAVGEVGDLVEGDHRRIHSANRRVVAYFFEPGTRVGDWWPCPVAGAGHDTCPKRFWSDAESRRKPPSSGFVQYWPAHARGEPEAPFVATEEVFACRFYERLARATSCELVRPPRPRPPKKKKDDDKEKGGGTTPPTPPPDPRPVSWDMHVTCSHAPEEERTNKWNLGVTSGTDAFEVVGADTIHAHSEPPHLPITWSTKSDAPESEITSGSTTFDVKPPELAKVTALSIYRAKPKEYILWGNHIGITRACTVRAYPPDEWRLDFEKIREPIRKILGPGLFAWNEIVELFVPAIENLDVKFLEADAVAGLMRIAWEEAPFDTGEAADPDFRAFPHFVFALKGEPVLLFGGELELSITALLKIKKLKKLYEKLPKKLRAILEVVKAMGSTEITFGGTQRVVIDSPDQDLRIGWDGPGKMEFEGSIENTLTATVEHEESEVAGNIAISVKGSPVLGFVFDPAAERFGIYLKGTIGPVHFKLSGEWKGVEPFDPIDEVVYEEEKLKRRELLLPVKQFREIFGD